jgi:hypothetical protein
LLRSPIAYRAPPMWRVIDRCSPNRQTIFSPSLTRRTTYAIPSTVGKTRGVTSMPRMITATRKRCGNEKNMIGIMMHRHLAVLPEPNRQQHPPIV